MKKTASKKSHEHWFALVEEQQTSGLSQKDFCQQKNIILSQFVYYRLLYRKQKVLPEPMTAFLPVKVAYSEPASSLSEIKLTLPNGFHCAFTSSMDMMQLKRMIGVLLTC
jgi:hypothetical protein